jgi:hypothetical protein
MILLSAELSVFPPLSVLSKKYIFFLVNQVMYQDNSVGKVTGYRWDDRDFILRSANIARFEVTEDTGVALWDVKLYGCVLLCV